MGLIELRYEIKWHHWGDADTVHFALAYRAIALSTIYLLDYIMEAIIFSRVEGILNSDVAALIAFRGSSWIQVLRWIFRNRPGRKDHWRICKRAALAVFFRVIVIAIDLMLLGMSIPHSIDVYEHEVGSSVMEFGDAPTPESLQVRFHRANLPPVRTRGSSRQQLEKSASPVYHSLDTLTNPYYQVEISILTGKTYM